MGICIIVAMPLIILLLISRIFWPVNKAALFEEKILNNDKKFKRVVLVTIDTLRADHLRPYGYTLSTSPFLEKAAAQGVVFRRAFAPISTTTASHASIFTGLYPVRHSVKNNDDILSDSYFTIAEFFQSLGFDTAGFTPVRFMAFKNVLQGFQTFYFPEDHVPDSPYLNVPGIPDVLGVISAKQLLPHVLKWLQGKTKEDSFFLWLHLYDVHQWEHRKWVSDDAIQGLPEIAADERAKFFKEKHGDPLSFFPSEEDGLAAMSQYDAQILFADKHIQMLFDEMEKKDFNRETLWILTSDHGEGLGNHDFKYHGRRIFNEQLHVPLIFYAPGVAWKMKTLDVPSSLVDIFPTLVEIFAPTEQASLGAIDGRSLLPHLTGTREKSNQHRAIYSQLSEALDAEVRKQHEALITLQQKELKCFFSPNAYECYDLEKDPYELKVLSPEELQQHTRAEDLKEYWETEVSKWLESPAKAHRTDDEFPETLKALQSLGYF